MDYILKATLLLSLFYAFYIVFLQKQTFFQWIRIFFFAGIFFAFIIPLIEIPIYVSKNLSQSAINILSSSPEASSAIITNTGFNLSLTQLIGIIYMLGVGFMSVRFLLQFLSLAHVIFSAKRTDYSNYTLVQTSKNITAFSFFNYIVLNESLIGKSDGQYILEHEKIHVDQRHSLDAVLAQILLILQWFNPLAWLYKKSMEMNLEFIADGSVQKNTTDTKAYQMLLVKTAIPEYQMVLANNFNTSLIKNRIIMLHKNPTKSTQKWKYALLLPVLLLFMYAFNRVEIPIYNDISPLQMTSLDGVDISVTITKSSDNKDLESLKAMFKQQGVDVSIKKVKRNNKNEITGIAIKAKTEGSNTSFSANSEEPIQPILIKFNAKPNSVQILSKPHSEHDMLFFSNDVPRKLDHIKILKGDVLEMDMDMDIDGLEHGMIFSDEEGKKITLDKDKNVFIIREEVKDGDGEKKIFIEILDDDEDGDKPVKKKIIKKWHQKGDVDTTIHILKDDDGETTFIVNGKKMTKKEFEAMDKEDIKELKIIKKKTHKD